MQKLLEFIRQFFIYLQTVGKPIDKPIMEDNNFKQDLSDKIVGNFGITLDQLFQIMPLMATPKNRPFPIEQIIKNLNSAMLAYQITTPIRQAAFIAQIAHESVELTHFEEMGGESYFRRYEGRKDLGNIKPGDGVKFHGRGPIETTGRDNYALLSKVFNQDFLEHPEKIASIEWGFMTSAYWWQKKGLNELSDKGDNYFEKITKIINGGTNGLASRLKYYHRAKMVLGVDNGSIN